MQKRTKHIRLFRVVYRHPQLSNILCGIYIRIRNIATDCAAKVFTVSITNMLTGIAGLACIMRVHNCNGNTNESCLIFKKGSQLIKSPGVMLSSLRFADRCSSPYASQVLNGNPFILVYRPSYNALADRMVNDSGMSLFSAFKPFQEPSASFCAFALDAATHLKIVISNLIERFRTKTCSIGECCNICYSKIHTYKFFNVLNIIFWNFNGLEKIKLAIFYHKISLPFNVWKIFVIVAKKRDFQSAVNGPERNNHALVGKNARIVGDGAEERKRPFLFPVKFIGINYFTDATYNHLSGKTSSPFQVVIHKMVNFKLIKDFIFPYHIGNLITNCIAISQRSYQRFGLFITRKKFYLQCQFHGLSIIQILEKVKKGGRAFLPTASRWGILPA